MASLDRFVQAHVSRIRVFQLGHLPEKRFEPNAYAFLTEKVGTLLRSHDPGASLVFGALGSGASAWLQAIPPNRVAPYVKALALQDPIDLSAWVPDLAAAYPAVPLWLHAEPGDNVSILRRLHEARSAGVATFFARAEYPGSAGALLNLARALPSRFVIERDPPVVAIHETRGPPRPAPSDEAAEGPPGEPPAAAEPLGHFMDPLGPERAVVLPPARGGPGEGMRVTIGPDPLRGARAFDLESGRELALSISLAEAGAGATLVSVAPAAGPVLLRYTSERGPRGAAETVGVTAEYEMTAEEIIARQRAFDAAQQRGLRHYTAKAILSYHYRAETLNEAIDVTSVNRFFWRGGVGEYDETELFINGARWRGKAPSLPFIQAEKVKEVPIEIRLDASYTYRLEGRQEVDSHPCYVLAFEPVDRERSLFSGRVWVDERTFARRRIRLVQHGLKDPITSNADEIEYGEAAGPDRAYWLPLRGSRQMIFTVLGRTVAVERRAVYEEVSVNAPDFEQRRSQAYDSGRPILRDDETGYVYLVKESDGILTRRTDSLRNVAFFGGIGFNAEPSIGFPFAGINYFDFNWRGTGTQLDVAFAGPFLDVAWTDPRLGRSRWELSAEGRLFGLKDRFKRVTDIGFMDDEDLRVLEERALLTLARPVGAFGKTEVQLDLEFDNFDRAEHTDGAMVLPATSLTAATTGRFKYTRGGYLFDLWLSSGHRFGWEDWGLPGGGGGVAGDDAFQRWGASLLKAFYPGALQKVSLGATLNAGRRLDRFSRFRIGDFRNVRVRGYNGADITFDRGATGQIGYLVALPRGGVSVEFSAEGALIENEEDFGARPRLDPDVSQRTRSRFEPDGIRERVVGGGAGVSFSGPWGTLVSVRGGWGIVSTLDINGGTGSFRVLFIKTFDHWPWGSRPSEPPPALTP